MSQPNSNRTTSLPTYLSKTTLVKHGMATPTTSPKADRIDDIDVGLKGYGGNEHVKPLFATADELAHKHSKEETSREMPPPPRPYHTSAPIPTKEPTLTAPLSRRPSRPESQQLTTATQAPHRTVLSLQDSSNQATPNTGRKRKSSTGRPQVKSSSAQPRQSLCATHPSQYQPRTVISSAPPAKIATAAPAPQPQSLAEILCSPPLESREYRPTWTDPAFHTVITRNGPPSWQEPIVLSNRDTYPTGPYVLSPTWMIGLPLGEVIELAHRYEKSPANAKDSEQGEE